MDGGSAREIASRGPFPPGEYEVVADKDFACVALIKQVQSSGGSAPGAGGGGAGGGGHWQEEGEEEEAEEGGASPDPSRAAASTNVEPPEKAGHAGGGGAAAAYAPVQHEPAGLDDDLLQEAVAKGSLSGLLALGVPRLRAGGTHHGGGGGGGGAPCKLT